MTTIVVFGDSNSYGLNDLTARFDVTPEDIANAVEVLVEAARASQAAPGGAPPKVLVIAPPIISETACLAGSFTGGAAASARIGASFAARAHRIGVPLLDAAPLIESDPLDGAHLAHDQHAALGRAAATAVKALL